MSNRNNTLQPGIVDYKFEDTAQFTVERLLWERCKYFLLYCKYRIVLSYHIIYYWRVPQFIELCFHAYFTISYIIGEPRNFSQVIQVVNSCTCLVTSHQYINKAVIKHKKVAVIGFSKYHLQQKLTAEGFSGPTHISKSSFCSKNSYLAVYASDT